MRAARLISLVLLLQSRGSMTGPDLAGELEVSERTVARDVLALAEAGVPVYAERGRHGGYRLLGGYRTRLTGLHRGEAEALLLAAIPGPAAEMGLTGEVASARRKISAALAPGAQDAPERVSRRFHLDAPGWFRRCGTPPLLGELAEAVWQDRSVRAVYRRGDREVRRDVEPHGLVLKAGAWYVACRVGQRFLVYRADRFQHVELAGPFDRDESFDLPGFWQRRSEDFARSLLRDSVTVRLTPAGVRALPVHLDRFAAEHAEHGETDEQGLVTATLPVESLDVAYDQLLALGPEVEVLAPPELRGRMARAAARFAGLYAEAGELGQLSGSR
ncbi:MAG: WYL domain-containing protein [Saccharopolyspora sp.]|uniref:helix-turn-helix transcriptional regulator n=1 Tax=Saccharopolyspora sp. TaxID=33915 RepID=UPI0025EBD2CD|nr:WYL domain-containing protein [Saccharopolyspora sp.]MBQ6640184.1 WYL domain-containing protein [Saccharopolyspora sp.]